MTSPVALASLPTDSVSDRQTAQRRLLLATIALAYAPLLLRFSARLWSTDHYSFFPLLLIASSGLIYARVREQGRLTAGASSIQAAGLGLSLLLLVPAVLLTSPYVAAISALCLILSVAYAFGNWRLVRAILPAWLLLWLAVPLPLGFDSKLILALQRVATAYASGLLDYANYWHYVDGMVIHRPTRSYQVEEACSGIHSLFSSLFFTGVYLILIRSGPLRSVLVLLSACFWVVVANVVRVAAVVVLVESLGIAVDQGLAHAILGVIVFVICLGLIAGTERLFAYIWPLSKSKRSRRRSRKDRTARRFTSKPLPGSTLVTATVFSSVLVLIQFISLVAGGSISGGELRSIRLLQSDGADLLPIDVAGWRRVSYERVNRAASNSNGSVSRVWLFEKDGLRCHLSIDGPFQGWHNLGDCLGGQGWTLRDWEAKQYREGTGGFVEVSASKGRGQQAFVLFGLFDSDSRPFQIPASEFNRQFEFRFANAIATTKRLFGIGDPTVADSDSRSYQLQVFVEQASRFADDEKTQAREIFHAARQLICSADES